ncbi:MAG: hypothetical protein PVG69_08705, partial [Desulfobacterales bacterium]
MKRFEFRVAGCEFPVARYGLRVSRLGILIFMIFGQKIYFHSFSTYWINLLTLLPSSSYLSR